jgi:predicted nucleotidyltransferase
VNLEGKTLAEVAAIVDRQMYDHGMRVVVVGGSAITIHVPDVYTSEDIDLAITTGIDKRRISAALRTAGFVQDGRAFRNATTRYTVDIVADAPFVGDRPITDYEQIETPSGSVTVLRLEDAVADRIAAFLYWNDSQSLDVAERAVAAGRSKFSLERLESVVSQLDHRGFDLEKRFELALARLRAAYRSQPGQSGNAAPQ